MKLILVVYCTMKLVLKLNFNTVHTPMRTDRIKIVIQNLFYLVPLNSTLLMVIPAGENPLPPLLITK